MIWNKKKSTQKSISTHCGVTVKQKQKKQTQKKLIRHVFSFLVLKKWIRRAKCLIDISPLLEGDQGWNYMSNAEIQQHFTAWGAFCGLWFESSRPVFSFSSQSTFFFYGQLESCLARSNILPVADINPVQCALCFAALTPAGEEPELVQADTQKWNTIGPNWELWILSWYCLQTLTVDSSWSNELLLQHKCQECQLAF